MKKKLSIKMIVLISALVFVVAVGLGFMANYFVSDTVRTEAQKSIMQISDLGATEVRTLVEGRLDVLYEVANGEKVRSMNWNLQKEDIEKNIERLGYQDIIVVTPDGKARYVKSDAVILLDDQDYVKRALNGEKNVS